MTDTDDADRRTIWRPAIREAGARAVAFVQFHERHPRRPGLGVALLDLFAFARAAGARVRRRPTAARAMRDHVDGLLARAGAPALTDTEIAAALEELRAGDSLDDVRKSVTHH